jgi:hypothetical protein
MLLEAIISSSWRPLAFSFVHISQCSYFRRHLVVRSRQVFDLTLGQRFGRFERANFPLQVSNLIRASVSFASLTAKCHVAILGFSFQLAAKFGLAVSDFVLSSSRVSSMLVQLEISFGSRVRRKSCLSRSIADSRSARASTKLFVSTLICSSAVDLLPCSQEHSIVSLSFGQLRPCLFSFGMLGSSY